MLGKGNDQRVDETVAFIRANRPATSTPAEYALIVQALEAWRRTASADTRARLSALMSQTGTAHRPTDETGRAYRRATILLKCAIEEPETRWTATANLINTYSSNFATWYEWGVRDVRDHVYSMPGVARADLDLLRQHPRRFLTTYKLVVNGKSNAGAIPYGFRMRAGAYELDCLQPGLARVQVRAINVPATSYSSVQGNPGQVTATLSSIDNGCDLMLTTQFTGCCYCFMTSGGNLAAAHIDPQGHATGVTGQTVSQAMRDNGGFQNGNGGTFQAYGRVADGSAEFGYPQSATQMIVVAVKRGGAWRVYSQTELAGALTVRRLDA